MYIMFSISLVSLITLRSSGTDILYGCHLLLDVCIYIYIRLKIKPNRVRIRYLSCQIIILSIYVPSTHAYTHVLHLSLDLPYEKR